MAPKSSIVDALDRKIVERLRVDGREPNSALAAALDVNQATIAARLRRLDEANAMRVVALTDMEAFGLDHMAFAFIRVRDRAPIDVSEDIAAIPDVISTLVTTGRYDVIAILLTRSRTELGDLIGDALPKIPGVSQVRCEFAVEMLRYDSDWASLAVDDHAGTGRGPLVIPGDVVDEIDLTIIQELQRDARMSHRRIATHLKVSEGTVRVRVRRLEAAGLIRIRAVCDVGAFGLTSFATVGVHVRGGYLREVGEQLGTIEGVGALIRTLGEFDYILILLTETREALLDKIFNRVQSLPGVSATETFEGAAAQKHVYTWVRLYDRPEPSKSPS